MGEDKKPCKECGEVHNVRAIEVLRGKVKESMEAGVCVWCGKKIGEASMEEHVRIHVIIGMVQVQIGELQTWMIKGKVG